MPLSALWYFQWPDALKKRACRYLLQRYLGQYLKEKLTLNQLSVDLYNGTGTIKELSLDTEALNEMANTYSLPIEFVDGYIESISVSIPWTALLNDSSYVEVRGLMMTIQPKQRTGSATSLMDSILSAHMTTSMQLAEECMRQNEQDEKDAEPPRPLEGLEMFAQTIDSVLCRIKVRFVDTTLRLEHVPKGSKTGIALEIRVKLIDYYDEAGTGSGQAADQGQQQRNVHEPAVFTCKIFHWEGVTLYTDEFAATSRTISKSMYRRESSPESKTSEYYSIAPDTSEWASAQGNIFDSYHQLGSGLDNLAAAAAAAAARAQTSMTAANLATQSDPILVAKLSGRHEIRLKLKQCDTISGPKVSIDFNVGSVVVFLSPRQVYVLLELLSGLVSPEVEDTSNVAGHYSCSKPMQNYDYERVEHEMQKQLHGGHQTRSLQPHQAWSSQCLDDSDEEFHPLGSMESNRMTGSTISEVSTQVSDSDSMCSSIYLGANARISQPDVCSQTTNVPNFAKSAKASNFGFRYPLDDPMGEITSFRLQLSCLVVTILHEDILTPAVAGSGLVAQSSVLQMKAQADAFFDQLGVFTLNGLDDKDLESVHERLSSVCKSNHLRFIGTPCTLEGTDKMSSTMKNISANLTFGTAELLECLFDKKSSSSQPVPEYCRLLSFPKVANTPTSHYNGPPSFHNPSMYSRPCMKVKFNLWEQFPTKRPSRTRKTIPPKPSIQINLETCVSEVDITIVDRIACLLHPQKLCSRSPQPTPAQPTSFGYLSQAMEEGATVTAQKTELSISSPSLTLNVRFPIPDLRPANEVDRAQWWNRNIRDDVLILKMTEARLFTVLDDSDQGWSLDVRCQELQGLFQENPINPPVSFLHACPGDNHLDANTNLEDSEGFDWPRLSLKVGPPAPLVTVEENDPEYSDDATPVNSLDTLVQQLCSSDADAEPSPFSTRRVVYESQHSGSRDNASRRANNESTKGEQMVLPGERSEVASFIERSTAMSQFVIDLSCANLHLVLPNKHFYEVLYNRITTDLLLWEPTAPMPAHKETCNIRPTNVNFNWAHMQDTVNQPFSMFKSAMQNDSSSDSEEECQSYLAFDECKTKPRRQRTRSNNATRQNKLCFTLNSKRAVIALHTPLRDANKKVIPEHRGEVQLHLMDAAFFAVSMAPGSATAGYMCLHINRANVYHKGVLRCSPYDSSDIGPANLTTPAHLHPTLYPTEFGALTKPAETVGGSGETADTLLVSVRISLDPVRNMKTFCVSLAVRGTTLRHRVVPGAESCFSQFLDFFDVVDYPVSGYRPPEVLTELHLHVWACAIDYRPLYLPIRVMLTMESFSVCSNIAPQTSTSVIRIIIEDAYLFLSKKCHASAVNLRKDYVCVIDMSFFELFIRSSDGRDQKQPKLDMQASNNILNVRTCVDSCLALQDVLRYFASDGDLRDNQPASPYPSDSDLESTLSSLQSEGISPGSCGESEEHMHSLMAEAMRESSSLVDRTSPDSRVCLFPDETREPTCDRSAESSTTQRAAQLSTTQRFDISDDDDDEEDGSTDEDFCILENDPGVGIMSGTGEPQIRVLTNDPIVVKENHFQVPIGRIDRLKSPKHYPTPVTRYTLREISVVWHLYGGEDFSATPPFAAPGKRPSFKSMDSLSRKDTEVDSGEHLHFMSDYVSPPSGSSLPGAGLHGVAGVSFSKSKPSEVRWQPSSPSSSHATRSSPGAALNWQTRGGVGRLHELLMELQMNKISFQHETYPDDTVQASRQVLLVHELELRDRLVSSAINKFLYQYTSEEMPKQTHANMIVIKALHLRPDVSLPATQECVLRVSILPLRFNIDQDALYFLYNFMSSLFSGSGEAGGLTPTDDSVDAPSARFGSMESVRSGAGGASATNVRLTPRHHPVPVRSVVSNSSTPPPSLRRTSPVTVPLSRSSSSDSQNLLITFEEENAPRYGRSVSSSSGASTVEPGADAGSAGVPIFFRSFTFAPEVPIRVDYNGKRVEMDQGALTGLIMGLGQLNCSELRLKKLYYRHGLLGVDKVLSYAMNLWLQDIKQTQIPGLLGGVGPLHSVVQLVQGIRDLFWLPIEQYRKDGRIVRGLQRGANAFTTSTAMAALELANRLVQAVQCTAETAYDVVSPGPSVRRQGLGGQHLRKRHSQPADIREGMTNAYNVVRDGLGDTARTLVQVATEEHEHKGISGAVGGVLRQIPSTVVRPIILATEATSNVLGGMRHQLAPDVRREAAEKWRSDD